VSRRRGRLAVALVVLVVGACEDALPTPSPTTFVAPTPTVTTYHLGTSVWHSGLVMRFDSATAELDASGGRASVQASITNPGPDDLTLTAPIRIVAGAGVFEPTRDSVLPTIVAGQTGYTTLRFELVGLSSLDDAVLRVGDPAEHQGIVPFVAGTIAAVTLEPVPFKPSGSVTAGKFRLTLRSGEVRWDLPDWAQELPTGTVALTLTYDVTNQGGFSGGNPFTAHNVELRLPDGTRIAPRPDGRSQSSVLVRPGRTIRGLFSRFEIPDGMAGTYALILSDAGDVARIRFSLPE
jgi:hypothetical protein